MSLIRRHGRAVLASASLALLLALALVVPASPAAAATRTLAATPATGLVDLQTVSVSGSGWTLGARVLLCQAEGGHALPGDGCMLLLGFFSASATDGTLAADVSVRQVLQMDGRTVDCRVTACTIVGVEVRPPLVIDRATETVAPIAFAPERPMVIPGVGATGEGDGSTTTIEVPVHLSGASTDIVTVPWTTIHVPGASGAQAAPADDYVAATGTATFPPGVTDITVAITVNGDTTVEGDEYLVVSFNNPTNAVMGGFWGLGFGVIGNDD